MATTSWPTRRLAEEPSVIGVSPEAPCARTTAMSLLGSVPTTVNVRGAAVGEGHLGLRAACRRRLELSLAAGHDVVVGQDQAVGGQDDAGALLGLPADVDLELDHAGHHLGRDLLDRAGGQAGGGHAGRGAVMLDWPTGRSGCTSSATPPPMPAETIATARAPAVKAPARERFWGDRQARRLRAGGCGRAAVRVVGRAETCCCGRVAPVVRLLLVRAGPLRTGVSGAACSCRRAGDPAAGGGGEYLGWFVMSLRCSSSSRFRHLEQRRMHRSQCPSWAENPLREHSGHPQTFLPYRRAPIKHCRR